MQQAPPQGTKLAVQPALRISKRQHAAHVRPYSRASRDHSICTLAAQRDPPWAMTFDLRERETEWTDENKVLLTCSLLALLGTSFKHLALALVTYNHCLSSALVILQARLVTLFASEELNLDLKSVQQRMQDLVQVVPDLGGTSIATLCQHRNSLLASNYSKVSSIYICYICCAGLSAAEALCSSCVDCPAAGKKVHHMKPGLLASLLKDTSTIADRAIRLKELLPRINVSAMASRLPEVLLQVDAPQLHAGWLHAMSAH